MPLINLANHAVYNIQKICGYFTQYTEPLIIKRRLWLYKCASRYDCADRLYRLREYNNKKMTKDIHRKNMELMVRLSNEKNIPQYHLLEIFDRYSENSILDPYGEEHIKGSIKYIHESLINIKNHIKSFFLYLKEYFLEHGGEEFQYNILEFILIKMRKKTYLQKNLILNRWQFMKFHREQRERRIRRIKRNKNFYQKTTHDAT